MSAYEKQPEDKAGPGDQSPSMAELQRAARAGNIAAQYELAGRFARGEDVARDELAAFVWYEKAADKGFVPAMHDLALICLHGRGATQDVDRGLVLLFQAADMGYFDAQYTLGLVYEDGLFVPPDRGKARNWYLKAALRGHGGAQFNLGLMYVGPFGVLVNCKLTWAWWFIAARQGDEEAGQMKEIMACQMRPQEIAAAEVMAANLQEKIGMLAEYQVIYLEHRQLKYRFEADNVTLYRICHGGVHEIVDVGFDEIFYFGRLTGGETVMADVS